MCFALAGRLLMSNEQTFKIAPGNRTPDVLRASQVRELRSLPRAHETKKAPHLWGLFVFMARPERFELPTSWFVAMRSIQLSYGRVYCE